MADASTDLALSTPRFRLVLRWRCGCEEYFPYFRDPKEDRVFESEFVCRAKCECCGGTCAERAAMLNEMQRHDTTEDGPKQYVRAKQGRLSL